ISCSVGGEQYDQGRHRDQQRDGKAGNGEVGPFAGENADHEQRHGTDCEYEFRRGKKQACGQIERHRVSGPYCSALAVCAMSSETVTLSRRDLTEAAVTSSQGAG